MASSTTKKTGKFHGKSNTLGQGGRAAQLKAQGVPEGVIGDIARMKGAAPGQKNFHRTKKRATDDPNKNDGDKLAQDKAAQIDSKSRKHRKAKRPIEQQPKAMVLEKEPDVVATPTGKKLTEGFRKRKAHRSALSTVANVGKNFTKNVGNGLAKASGWPGGINNISANKSGTIGTEPMSKGNSKFTEVKAGPLAADIPMGTLSKRSKRTSKRSVVKRATKMSDLKSHTPIRSTQVAELTKDMAKRSMPQRRTHRSMSGLDMLNKATKRK